MFIVLYITKKFIIVGLVLSALVLSVIAEAKSDDYVAQPSWSEFCPSAYLEAKILSPMEIEYMAKENGTAQTDIFYCKYHGKTARIIRGLTILPALDCWGAKKIATSTWRKRFNAENVENSYWYERKTAFKNALEGCKNLSKDSKAMCYMKVRELEIQKNAYRQQNIYNQESLRQQSINNFNQTQINNNLQNINNNLRNINNKIWY